MSKHMQPVRCPFQCAVPPWDARDKKTTWRAHVTELRLGTTKNYCVLQCSTPVLLRTTKYDCVLQSTIILHTTKYYEVSLRTTKYDSVLQNTAKHYSVLPRKSYKELLRTTKYDKVPLGTTPYYQVRLRTTKYYSALSNTMELRHSCLIVPTHET